MNTDARNDAYLRRVSRANRRGFVQRTHKWTPRKWDRNRMRNWGCRCEYCERFLLHPEQEPPT